MSCKVAFIGLGVMGYPMAGYISKAGHDVTVYNRTKSKAEKWIGEYKGKTAETPMDAAKDCDFVFTCVGNDNDLEEVSTGKQGIYNTIKKGAIHIDNTTASANIARKLYASSKAHGWGFLDAPISGGQAGAEGGTLTVMVGGDQQDYDKAVSIIDCYSKKVKLMGPAGNFSCGRYFTDRVTGFYCPYVGYAISKLYRNSKGTRGSSCLLWCRGLDVLRWNFFELRELL